MMYMCCYNYYDDINISVISCTLRREVTTLCVIPLAGKEAILLQKQGV